jgi:hypothetical protein
MPPEQFFAESDPISEIVEQDDLDELVREWAAAIRSPDAEVARDDRKQPRPVRVPR